MVIGDFITGEMLTTFWGLVAATALIVQFTKPLVKERFTDVAVRIYAFIIALVLTFVFAYQGNGVQGVILTILNAMTVSIGAMGTYEIIVDPYAEKKKGGDIDD
jgi:hypothetical protein